MSAVAAPPRTSELVTGPLSRAIVRLALPAVGSALLQLVFLLVDIFWVGRILGAAALAAVSTAGYAVWILASLAEMIGVGLTAVAARRHGEGAHGAASVAAGTTLAVAVIGGVAIASSGWLLVPALFDLMGTPSEVTELGRLYLLTYLLGAPAVLGFFAAEATFRAAGDTRTPLVLLAASVLLTIVLDPLLITGVGPLPALGIAGAAIAAVLIRGVVLALGFVILVRRRLVRLSVWDWKSVLTVLRVGAPTAAYGVFFSAVYIGLARITTRFGVPALAALGIGHKLEGLSYMVATGFALASAALVGQNLGAQRPDRARRAGWMTAFYASGVGAFAALAFLAFPDYLVGVFTRDPGVVAAGASYLRIMSIVQVTMGLEIVLEAALGGAGFTLQPVLWMGVITGARIPLAAWLAGVFGVAGVWWAISVTAVARGVAMAILWRGESWQRVKV
ncbi:MAG: MATE family efflux transporter [Gemmatimonadetes bacterium]|nr:MATE family efflux transporter [Gemmatimonadota bacterium]